MAVWRDVTLRWLFSYRQDREPSMKRNPGIVLFVLVVLTASIAGALTPSVFPPSLFSEGGLIEDLTLVFYGLAILAVMLAPADAVGLPDKLAVCIVLAAFAARELDLHKALFGISILKARFYNRDGTAAQITEALLVLLPILASLAWLAKRHGLAWLAALRRHEPAAVTFLVFLVSLVVAQLSDRAPDTLSDWWHITVSETATHVLQGNEESLEMILPVLVACVVWQAGRARQAAGRSARSSIRRVL